MRSHFYEPTSERLSIRLRCVAAVFAFGMGIIGIFSFYFLMTKIYSLYARLYRNALVVETPYLIFSLLMAPPAATLFVVAGISSVFTGRKFDPPKWSPLFKFSTLTLATSAYTFIYIVPAVVTLTTATLYLRGYTSCPELWIAGSAWDVLWVNDDHLCFKPDHYINDNWPCKKINGRDVCVPLDGR